MTVIYVIGWSWSIDDAFKLLIRWGGVGVAGFTNFLDLICKLTVGVGHMDDILLICKLTTYYKEKFESGEYGTSTSSKFLFDVSTLKSIWIIGHLIFSGGEE